MTLPALRTIKSVAPRPGFRLTILWSGGATSMVDLSPSISAGGVFAPLQDIALFEKVRVGKRNRTIEWPEPVDEIDAPLIDIDADALSVMAASGPAASAAGKVRRPARPQTPSVPAKKLG